MIGKELRTLCITSCRSLDGTSGLNENPQALSQEDTLSYAHDSSLLLHRAVFVPTPISSHLSISRKQFIFVSTGWLFTLGSHEFFRRIIKNVADGLSKETEPMTEALQEEYQAIQGNRLPIPYISGSIFLGLGQMMTGLRIVQVGSGTSTRKFRKLVRV